MCVCVCVRACECVYVHVNVCTCVCAETETHHHSAPKELANIVEVPRMHDDVIYIKDDIIVQS